MDVVRIEYDPGRSAHIALLRSRNATSRQPFSYIVAPDGLRAGDVVQSYRRGIPGGLVPGYEDAPQPSRRLRRLAIQEQKQQQEAPLSPSAAKPTDLSNPYAIPTSHPSHPQSVLDPAILAAAQQRSSSSTSSSASLHLGLLRTLTIKPGNVLPLRLIPSGTPIHAITLDPQGPARLCRSAGTFAQVVAHDDKGKYTQVRLASGEVRHVLQNCVATIGKVSNPDWKLRSLGKAGRSRWLGKRPAVRGMAMNAYVPRTEFDFETLLTFWRGNSDAIIPMEVDAVNPKATRLLDPYGVGSRVNVLVVHPTRTETRWLFINVQEGRRNGRVLSLELIHAILSDPCPRYGVDSVILV